MVADWIMSLAASGAGALVGAAGTDAWQTARTGVVRLFQRGGPQPAAEAAAQLDADVRGILETPEADRDQVRQRLLCAWQTRLAFFLAEHAGDAGSSSEIAGELNGLTDAIRAKLPARQQIRQDVTASAPGAISQGVIYGSIYNHSGPISAATTADPAPAGAGADEAANTR